MLLNSHKSVSSELCTECLLHEFGCTSYLNQLFYFETGHSVFRGYYFMTSWLFSLSGRSLSTRVSVSATGLYIAFLIRQICVCDIIMWIYVQYLLWDMDM